MNQIRARNLLLRASSAFINGHPTTSAQFRLETAHTHILGNMTQQAIHFKKGGGSPSCLELQNDLEIPTPKEYDILIRIKVN